MGQFDNPLTKIIQGLTLTPSQQCIINKVNSIQAPNGKIVPATANFFNYMGLFSVAPFGLM